MVAGTEQWWLGPSSGDWDRAVAVGSHRPVRPAVTHQTAADTSIKQRARRTGRRTATFRPRNSRAATQGSGTPYSAVVSALKQISSHGYPVICSASNTRLTPCVAGTRPVLYFVSSTHGRPSHSNCPFFPRPGPETQTINSTLSSRASIYFISCEQSVLNYVSTPSKTPSIFVPNVH